MSFPWPDCICGHDAAMHTAVLLGGPVNRPCWAIGCPCHLYEPVPGNAIKFSDRKDPT